jgi:hypothetical protein
MSRISAHNHPCTFVITFLPRGRFVLKQNTVYTEVHYKLSSARKRKARRQTRDFLLVLYSGDWEPWPLILTGAISSAWVCCVVTCSCQSCGDYDVEYKCIFSATLRKELLVRTVIQHLWFLTEVAAIKVINCRPRKRELTFKYVEWCFFFFFHFQDGSVGERELARVEAERTFAYH